MRRSPTLGPLLIRITTTHYNGGGTISQTDSSPSPETKRTRSCRARALRLCKTPFVPRLVSLEIALSVTLPSKERRAARISPWRLLGGRGSFFVIFTPWCCSTVTKTNQYTKFDRYFLSLMMKKDMDKRYTQSYGAWRGASHLG